MASGNTPKAIKLRRERLGLTQVQFAEVMGVSWSTVARWETGARNMPRTAELLLGYIEGDRKGGRSKKARNSP
jgi:DNA-binding transcriptional regulator YiaG